eukprot:CAMPEP_0201955918 /NCGR_PEP_ID=MMETSP0904-20121228/3363_1 /ASSEMBLY_ACC=CAM_ASM_000553 /TAXON_ID=420261 /ORGANISM="Thalassiosira antarctica, Strain CCMP982" /LENGTH=141 /DNA_ID=CAMNT_0048500185 /DNA_START=59 /DNA_END=484 /DNA_ORIENTATION=-
MNWLISASAGSSGYSKTLSDLDESFEGGNVAFGTGAPGLVAVSAVAAGFVIEAKAVDFPRDCCASLNGGNIAFSAGAPGFVATSAVAAVLVVLFFVVNFPGYLNDGKTAFSAGAPGTGGGLVAEAMTAFAGGNVAIGTGAK